MRRLRNTYRIDPKSRCGSYEGYFRQVHGCAFTQKEIRQREDFFFTTFRRVASSVDLAGARRILEIGSGLGGLYSFLPSDKNYTGIDLDPKAVEFSNDYFNTDSFSVKRLEDLQEHEAFDLVFAFEVIEHLLSPIEGLQKIEWLLKPGGTFCGTSPYPYPKNIDDPTHTFVLHPRNWERLFNSCGFTAVELHPMSYIPLFWRLSKRLNPILPFYVPLPYVLSTSLIISRKP